jgi:biopolymer transport protein TolR
MAIKLNGNGGDQFAPMSEINVTPFVDVMLVLLIVFIVTAPLLAVGVDVDLPQAEAQALPSQDVPLVVSIDRDANVYLGEEPVEPEQLVARLADIVGEDEARRIYVRGDQTVTYGRIMEVMGLIIRAGFTRVSLVAELPSDG